MGPLSDELLARIVALAADAIICINAKHTITFFNDGASRIFGYSEAEMMGQPLGLLIPSRFEHMHTAHIAQFGTSPIVARQMGDRQPILGLRKNGEEFPAEAAIAKMMSPTGPIFSVVLRDVTEQRRNEALDRQLLADTEAAVKMRDEVLGLVSHDLRNPVNAVKMLAGAILRGGSAANTSAVPAEVIDHATVMLQAANQMDALIQDLLDVTRLDSGRLTLATHPMSLHETIAAAVDTLTPLAQELGVTVVNGVSESMMPINADADRIVQVLSNLVSNAIKFSPENGVVQIDAYAVDDVVTVSITDSGVGIGAEELPMVFDRFWQSRRTNRSGAGLGLAIARGIVRAHGGDVTIDSTLGAGTIVRFTLPSSH